MNAALMKHRPKESDPTKWEEEWNSATHTLEPLAKVLKEWRAGLGTVKRDDFGLPNHYAKLVSELAQAQVIDQILALLPDSVNK